MLATPHHTTKYIYLEKPSTTPPIENERENGDDDDKTH
jgi:hypothetical protein